ncbi:Fructose-1-phosphate phosphatase YqaB [Lacunisphaera limnophila]|uniref:phosphoglycolate phosphatase n=1 Tax=Lacunisphaera limnophila TaxID=1838286 RepID=A0A1D8AZ06_9BACT|nr:HAD family phosphatase [Lacunisphaera limnophila]AOS46128.1 Fructose-1-phosphate phosphatase YqaB [Lacunisphaera limnophila]
MTANSFRENTAIVANREYSQKTARVIGVSGVPWQIDTLLFDHDGTLVDTEWAYFDATREALGRHGIELGCDIWSELYLQNGMSSTLVAQALGLKEQYLDAFLAVRRELYYNRLEAIIINDNAHQLLAELRRCYRIGLVTSNSRQALTLLHGATGFLELFDYIVTGSEVKRCKPSPDIYLRAAGDMGAFLPSCLAIEDSQRGLAAALAANIACIAMPNKLTLRHDFSGALTVINSLAELRDFLFTPGPRHLRL